MREQEQKKVIKSQKLRDHNTPSTTPYSHCGGSSAISRYQRQLRLQNGCVICVMVPERHAEEELHHFLCHDEYGLLNSADCSVHFEICALDSSSAQ